MPKGTTSHLVAKKLIHGLYHCANKSTTESAIHQQASWTVRVTISERLLTPPGSNSTNRTDNRHISTNTMAHRTFDRNSPSSTGQVPRPTRLPLTRQLDFLRGPILYFDGYASTQASRLC